VRGGGGNTHPRACIVIAEEAVDDYVIFADVQMQKTNINIKKNPNVFVSFYDNELVHCLKADGVAEYLPSGEIFERVKSKLVAQSKFYEKMKAAIKVILSNIVEHEEEEAE